MIQDGRSETGRPGLEKVLLQRGHPRPQLLVLRSGIPNDRAMRRVWSRYLIGALVMTGVAPTAWASCGDAPVALQVLGSGGPFGVGRASAGYIVWVDGVGRIMVDAGGGTFARFHEAGARLQDLHVLALSHFHPDHSSEVPALFWPQRSIPRIAGPSGTQAYPSVSEFVDGLFESPSSLFRVLGTINNFETVTVDVAAREPTEVYAGDGVTVRGIGVPHGDVPTVGYRVDIGDASIGFSSDQLGTNPAFTELVRGADVLVIHFAASEAPGPPTSMLHARPSQWGQLARDAEVGSLLLSHLTESSADHSMSDLPGNIAHLRRHYDGPLVVADDLMCVSVE